MGVTNGNEVGVFLTELASSDRVLVGNNFLREVRVLESPEAKKTLLKFAIIHTVNVVLSVTHRNEIWVEFVDVHAGDLSALSYIALKVEKVLKGDTVIFGVDFFTFLFLFLFLFLGFLLLLRNKGALLLALLIFFIFS
jgi:hypothetical protein